MNVNERFKKWLRPEGIQWFNDIKKKHGTILAIWKEGYIIHTVHFQEGMQVRNWMRQQPEFSDKLNDHWLDDNWAEFVEKNL